MINTGVVFWRRFKTINYPLGRWTVEHSSKIIEIRLNQANNDNSGHDEQMDINPEEYYIEFCL